MVSGRVVVVGSINHDLVISVPHHPKMGETVLATELQHLAGGKGANQAVAAAQNGVPTLMVGAVGSDHYGEFQLQSLTEQGVNINAVTKIEGETTGLAVVEVDPDGNNRIAVIPGANYFLDDNFGELIGSLVEDDDVVLISLEISFTAIISVIADLSDRPVRLIVNPAPYRPLSQVSMESVDFLIPNFTEASAMVAGSPSDEADTVLGELNRMVSHGELPTTIVTLGEDGVAICVGEENYQVLPTPSTQVVDTTGAGDAFCGAFAAGLVMGEDLISAVGRGMDWASQVIKVQGARLTRSHP